MVSSTSAAVERSKAARKRSAWRRAGARIALLLRSAVRPVALSLIMFLLTFVRWLGVPSPFAAAYLAGVAQAPSVFACVGLAASLLLRLAWGLDVDAWQFVGCAALWALRRRCHPRSGVEAAALGGLAMMPRAVACMIQGQLLGSLLACTAVAAGMLASAALHRGLGALRRTGDGADAAERICALLPVLWCINGLGYFRIGSINLGHAAAVGCTAAYACAAGMVCGAAGGLTCGIALALGGHDSRVAFALAIIGVACGLRPVARRRYLCIALALGADALAFALTPLVAPPLSYWAAGAGAALYAILPQRAVERTERFLKGAGQRSQSMENAFVTQRIAHMQQAIRSLAEALPRMEEEPVAAGAELGGELCDRCAQHRECWGARRTRTERALEKAVAIRQNGEAVTEERLPALAQMNCARMEQIDGLAQDVAAQRTRRTAAQRKARYERELTLTHLAALSGTLGELGVLAAGESFNDLQAAHVISLTMEELRVPARLCYARRVDGHLQAAIEMDNLLPAARQLEALLRTLACQEQMPLSITRTERGKVELEEIPLYSATVGMASLSANEGEVCGDACTAKRCEGGRLLMMLCDGMGHGKAARQQSEKTLELLMLLLEAGYTRHQAITAVNGMMLGAHADDRFSTVDMVDVDLWTGDVYSEKLGACASWVVRGNHMKKLEGSSLPLGIMEEASPTASQYRLHSGDILVLMSDGVADVFSGDEQMRRMLSENLFVQPQRMADALLRGALVQGGGAPRDDMSVMVLLMMDQRQCA